MVCITDGPLLNGIGKGWASVVTSAETRLQQWEEEEEVEGASYIRKSGERREKFRGRWHSRRRWR